MAASVQAAEICLISNYSSEQGAQLNTVILWSSWKNDTGIKARRICKRPGSAEKGWEWRGQIFQRMSLMVVDIYLTFKISLNDGFNNNLRTQKY